MTTTTKPNLAVAKDQTVHVVGCPALAGSPSCTCPQLKNQNVGGIRQNIDRATGKLQGHFLPRYST